MNRKTVFLHPWFSRFSLLCLFWSTTNFCCLRSPLLYYKLRFVQLTFSYCAANSRWIAKSRKGENTTSHRKLHKWFSSSKLLSNTKQLQKHNDNNKNTSFKFRIHKNNNFKLWYIYIQYEISTDRVCLFLIYVHVEE